MNYFIVSCGYTAQFSEERRRMRAYINAAHADMKIVRCCVQG